MASSKTKTGQPIDLEGIEQGLMIHLDERIAYDLASIETRLKVVAEHQGKLMDIALRKRLAWTIILLTFLLNIFVVLFLWHLASNDQALIDRAYNIQPDQALELAQSNFRLVTPHVLMSLVGATTVQVGAALVVITQYLFPKKNSAAGPKRILQNVRGLKK